MKALIAYFSRKGNNYVSGAMMDLPVGNTCVAARKLSALTKAELFEIEPIREYPMDYSACTQVAQRELNENARPAIKDIGPELDNVDTVYLGYPNWWGTMPMPVMTWLSSHDFSGKTILPFCTNEGSGMGRSENDLSALCPSATIGKGLSLHGGSVGNADQAIKDWLAREGRMGK